MVALHQHCPPPSSCGPSIESTTRSKWQWHHCHFNAINTSYGIMQSSCLVGTSPWATEYCEIAVKHFNATVRRGWHTNLRWSPCTAIGPWGGHICTSKAWPVWGWGECSKEAWGSCFGAGTVGIPRGRLSESRRKGQNPVFLLDLNPLPRNLEVVQI